MGEFGENLTTEGLSEDSVHIGDRFSIGYAELMVTQPRLPCYKLAVKFQRDDMVKRFLASGRTGFYFAVTREGDMGAGDEIRNIVHDSHKVPVAEITRLYIAKRFSDSDAASLRNVVQVPALPESWKSYFSERLAMANL